MGIIRSSIQLYDGMTPVLKSVTNALNITISHFEQMQRISRNNIDTTALQSARNELRNAESAIIEMEQSLKGVSPSIEESDRNMRNFNRHTQESNTSISKLTRGVKNLVASYISFRGLQMGIKATDTFANQEARLSLIVDDNGSIEELENKIYGAAQRSSGSYNDMLATVAKLGITAKKAFRDNNELIRFSELMQKAFRVGGASSSEAANGMYQLTQAMASGRLQGDEFRSIIENAPLLANAIAEYTGEGMEGLKKLSSDGKISSDIIKNALFSAAQEIEQNYAHMPVTFATAWTDIKNTAIIQSREMMQKVSAILNSDIGRNGIENIKMAIANVINIVMQGMAYILQLANMIQQHWAWLSPIITTAVVAFGAYKTAVLASSAATGVASFVNAVYAIAAYKQVAALAATELALMGNVSAQTMNMLATSAATAAQYGFNAALLSNPLTWVIVLIIGVIAVIAKWIKSVGGIKIAWMILKDTVLSVVENIILATMEMKNSVLGAWDSMMKRIKIWLNDWKNYLGDIKVNSLQIIQDFVNGAIDLLNRFSQKLNSLFGTSFEVIEYVTFASESKMKQQALKNQRQQELDNWIAEKEDNKIQRQQEYEEKQRIYRIKQLERGDLIAAAQREAKKEQSKGFDFGNISLGDFSNIPAMDEIADNTKKIADTVEKSSDELEFLRKEAITKYSNQYMIPQVHVEMINHNAIQSDLDLDGIIDKMTDEVENALLISAEGVYL